MDLGKRLAFALFPIFMVIAAGTAGYSLMGGWSLFDSLCMTVITLTTAGYIWSARPDGGREGVYCYTNIRRRLLHPQLRGTHNSRGRTGDVFGRKKVQDAIRKLNPGDTLVAIGEASKLRTLKELAGAKGR